VKITLSQPELSHLASLGGNVVPSKSTLPILSTLLLDAKADGVTVSATDLDLSIHIRSGGEVQKPGSVAVPARRFAEIVRKLESVEVQMESTAGALSIKCGRAHFQIPCMEAADFPKLPSTKGLETFHASSASFRSMIRRTRYAASQDLARPTMNGVLVEIDAEKVRMVATDGHRLACCVREETLPTRSSHTVIIPAKALDQLLRLLPDEGELEMGISETQAFFRAGSVDLFTRLIDGPFPNFEQVLPKSNDKRLSVNTEALLTATDRVSTLAASLSTKQIKLVLEKDQISLEVASPDVGKAKEDVECSYAGEPMSIGYNAAYLLDVLKNISSDEVLFKLDRPDNAGIIEPLKQAEKEHYFTLLMPLKLSD